MKKRIIFYIPFLLLSILAFTLMLYKYNEKKSFNKPLFDDNAIIGTPIVNDDFEYNKLDAEGLYAIALCGKPKLENNKLKIYLTLLENNNVYIKAKIFKNDKLVGESGIIKPGEYIEYINVKKIQKKDQITIKIMGYEIDNYYSAGVITIDLDVR